MQTGGAQRHPADARKLHDYWTKDPRGLNQWAEDPHPWTGVVTIEAATFGTRCGRDRSGGPSRPTRLGPSPPSWSGPPSSSRLSEANPRHRPRHTTAPPLEIGAGALSCSLERLEDGVEVRPHLLFVQGLVTRGVDRQSGVRLGLRRQNSQREPVGVSPFPLAA